MCHAKNGNCCNHDENNRIEVFESESSSDDDEVPALKEEPKGIQDRTSNPALKVDLLQESDATPWHAEEAMGEEPVGIQERDVAPPMVYMESSRSRM